MCCLCGMRSVRVSRFCDVCFPACVGEGSPFGFVF
jgi:hypothetical protein